MSKLISASSALKIAESAEKRITIEGVSKMIEHRSAEGYSELVIIGMYLPFEVKNELFNAGYKFRKALSPIGETCHVIMWD